MLLEMDGPAALRLPVMPASRPLCTLPTAATEGPIVGRNFVVVAPVVGVGEGVREKAGVLAV